MDPIIDQVTVPPAPVPEPLTAGIVQAAYLRGLAAKVAANEPVTDREYERLAAWVEEDRARQPGPADRVAAEIAALQAAGRRVPVALLKAEREGRLLDLTAHIWRDAGAAAADLGVSVQTIRNWCQECEIPHQRVPIVKAILFRALWIREQERARDASTEADRKEQSLRIAERQARIDEKAKRHLLEAQDAAREVVQQLIGEVRSALVSALPGLLADQAPVPAGIDRMAWEGQIRRCVESSLAAFAHRIREAPEQTDYLEGQS